MDITELNGVLKKAFRQECQLVDDSHLFYKIEFPNQFNINEFEEFAEDCEKFLSQYDIKTGATSIRYPKESHKLYVLQINKLPLEKFLEKLAALNKDLKLHEAIMKPGADQYIQELLSQGAQVNSSDIDGESPLHIAAIIGYDERVQLLLEKGASIKGVNNNGETALHIVVQTDHVSTLKKLLATPGIMINSKDKSGNTCLHLAAYLGNQEMLDKLFQSNITSESVNIQGETPLFSAVYGVNLSSVEFLLSKGAKVNHQNFNGTTALITAVILADLKVPMILPVVNMLLNYGADVTIVTKENYSALQVADQSNNTEIGSRLIDSLLIKDLMATKPCFLSDKLSFYWDKTVQKLCNKPSLQKISNMEEGKTRVHKVEKSPSFASNGAKFFNGTGEDKQAEESQTMTACLNK